MIVPDLHRYGCVLVASHGNTLCALVKHLEGASPSWMGGAAQPHAIFLLGLFE
jgi:bisphosphoglycerate-dependent phosphoglycerate mutase